MEKVLSLIVTWLSTLPSELLVVILALLPISELRGAIPLGLYLGISLPKTFLLAVLGNIIFVAPALYLFEPVSTYLRKFKIWARFFEWVFERTRKKSEQVLKYETLGLFFLVAVPLPMTGAWTGVIAATLFKIRFRYAFIAIVSGVILAGIIVSLLCALGLMSLKAVSG